MTARSANLKRKLNRLADIPKDFEWREMVALLSALGFVPIRSGGSHVKFHDPSTPGRVIRLVRPHGRNPLTIPTFYLQNVVATLTEWGYYDE